MTQAFWGSTTGGFETRPHELISTVEGDGFKPPVQAVKIQATGRQSIEESTKMSCAKTYLTNEVKALIGATAERVEASMWGIEKEGLRRFTQAIMDPDPRFWDEEFAKTTKFGEVVTPAIYCSYLNRRTPPGADDPITRAFAENPESDGIGGLHRDDPGRLPSIPTDLKRVLNGGNEIEVYKYPTIGDKIFSQSKITDIRERVTRDGSHMLITITEHRYTNQDDELLCILRAVGLLR
jgi:hypothetical protein|tara:strand:+ start:1555 stop:2265 length:711 start_codon:yes stop_codon:yes gene_type:complete